MSEIDRLIKELCPDGVNTVHLEDVIVSLNTGLNPRQFFRLNTDDAHNFYVTIRELQNNRIVFTKKTDRMNDDALRLCNNRSNLEVGDVLFSGTGTIGETAIIEDYPTNWNIKEGVYTIKPDKAKILSRFLMYLLMSQTIKAQYLKKAAGGTVKSVPMGEMRKLCIPLPPIPVQNKIVENLDKLTKREDELELKLEAEREARIKQYEIYRDALLSFSSQSIFTEEESRVRWVTLGEIAIDIYRGSGITRDQVVGRGTPCVRYGEIYTTYNIWFDRCVSQTDETKIANRKYFEHGDILFAITGESVEDIAKSCVYVGHGKCLAGGDIVVLKHKQNSKYLSYALSTTDAKEQKGKGKVKSKVVHSSVPAISGIRIPLPSFEVQERIVSILDRFDTLTKDITSGLTAEIAAHRKQYEYYRDKLLTFKEKTA